jgi:streptomycin 6-kinase
MTVIPDDFARFIAAVFEEDGKIWLQRLPGLLVECERRWSLQIQAPFELSYNYVAPAMRADGTEVVLKLGVPRDELLTEADALHHYAGRGSARLIDADKAQGIMLLERIRPGTMLVETEDDDQATAIAAEVMGRLWQPAPKEHSFPAVADWARGIERLRAQFDGGVGPYPKRLVEMAETLFRDLLASTDAQVVCHGDLHHYNILASEAGHWVAIDPKGIIGEPAFEIYALLKNPGSVFDRPDYGPLLARRIDLLAEILGLDRRRLIGWGVAMAVLSSWWSYEDEGANWQPVLRCADLLAAMLD